MGDAGHTRPARSPRASLPSPRRSRHGRGARHRRPERMWRGRRRGASRHGRGGRGRGDLALRRRRRDRGHLRGAPGLPGPPGRRLHRRRAAWHRRAAAGGHRGRRGDRRRERPARRRAASRGREAGAHQLRAARGRAERRGHRLRGQQLPDLGRLRDRGPDADRGGAGAAGSGVPGLPRAVAGRARPRRQPALRPGRLRDLGVGVRHLRPLRRRLGGLLAACGGRRAPRPRPAGRRRGPGRDHGAGGRPAHQPGLRAGGRGDRARADHADPAREPGQPQPGLRPCPRRSRLWSCAG